MTARETAGAEPRSVSVERAWAVALADLGIDGESVLRRAGLPFGLFLEENARLTVTEFFRLWDAIVTEAADPRLPIRLAESASTDAFHPPQFAALCSPNLKIAARRIGQFKRLVAPVTVVIGDGADGFFVGMRWDDPSVRLPTALAAVELAWLVQIARLGTRERIVPLRVESPYALEPTDAYAEFFGTLPVIGTRHGVSFHPDDASKPFLTASESMWSAFEPELQRRLTKLDASVPFSQRVRSVLLESLPAGEASIELTAKRLGLGTRTLQRRLQPEGMSYKDIVRQTRERLARHYLSNTQLAYGEISFLVGFEEPSSFFRAFREWTGETPESVRRGLAS